MLVNASYADIPSKSN